MKVELEVRAAEAGWRLDVWLAKRVDGLSRARAKALIERGGVRLNGRAVAKSYAVSTGDQVAVDSLPPPSDFDALADDSMPLEVVYEDAHLVVVDKPPGIPSHPLNSDERGTLANALVHRYPEMRGVGYRPREPGIVHRLDVFTSGLMIAAKDASSFEVLRNALRKGEIQKHYVALCDNAPPLGKIDLSIASHSRDARKVQVCRTPVEERRYRAQQATTEVLRVEPRNGDVAVWVSAYRARRHQIRVHLAAVDCPLLGDAMYGGTLRDGITHHLLRAHYLAFRHPVTGQATEVHVGDPYPQQLPSV